MKLTKITVAEIQIIFEANRNPEIAVGMKKYMKNKFECLGIKSPLRNEISKPFYKESKKLLVDEIVTLVKQLWSLPEREYQYLAIEILRKNIKKFTSNHLSFFKQLLEEKSWWDSVDSLSTNIIGGLLINNSKLRPEMDKWIYDNNLWVRRCAIIHQLKYKSKTNENQLFEHCLICINESDFFIRKAIGWALRQHAKLAPENLLQFVNANENELSGLSKREALKHFS